MISLTSGFNIGLVSFTGILFWDVLATRGIKLKREWTIASSAPIKDACRRHKYFIMLIICLTDQLQRYRVAKYFNKLISLESGMNNVLSFADATADFTGEGQLDIINYVLSRDAGIRSTSFKEAILENKRTIVYEQHVSRTTSMRREFQLKIS